MTDVVVALQGARSDGDGCVEDELSGDADDEGAEEEEGVDGSDERPNERIEEHVAPVMVTVSTPAGESGFLMLNLSDV